MQGTPPGTEPATLELPMIVVTLSALVLAVGYLVRRIVREGVTL